jgi:hypothetical protein
MAYLYRRKGPSEGRIEIREAHTTPRGPRSRTLASFRGALTDEQLDRAEQAAARPFDRAALVRRAVELGIRAERTRADAAARQLIARLRSGAPLDPRLASVLREQLAQLGAEPLPEELADVAEWIGASELERGRALRDVLRLYDTIARSREPARSEEPARFPRIPTRARRRRKTAS